MTRWWFVSACVAMFTTNQDYVIQQQILSYYVVEHICLLLQSHYNRTLQSPNTTQFKACVLSHSIELTIGYSCTTGTLVILTFIFVTSELQAVSTLYHGMALRIDIHPQDWRAATVEVVTRSGKFI